MHVMKFGGTSVADPAAIARLIGIVRGRELAAARRVSRRPVVVVSALSKVTDHLLAIAARALDRRHRRRRRQLIDELRAPSLDTAAGVVTRSRAAGPRWCRRSTPISPSSTTLAHALVGAARGVAAPARRDGRDRRAVEQPDRRRRARRRRPARRRWVDARAVLVTDGEHAGAAADGRDPRAAAARVLRPLARRRTTCRCSAASSARPRTA